MTAVIAIICLIAGFLAGCVIGSMLTAIIQAIPEEDEEWVYTGTWHGDTQNMSTGQQSEAVYPENEYYKLK